MKRQTFIALFLSLGGVLALHVSYLFAGFFVFDHGTEDPIFGLTGIPRKLQLEITAWPFLLLATFGLARSILRRFAAPQFRDHTAAVCLVFVLLFLNFLASSTEVFVEELHAGFWPQIALHLGFVLVIELALVILAIRFLRSPHATAVVLSTIVTASAFALFLLLLDVYLARSTLTHVGVAVVLFIGVYTLFRFVSQPNGRWRPLAGILVITAVAPVVNAAIVSDEHRAPDALSRYDSIRFAETPDIHIIAFESLIPPTLTKSILGIEDIAYADVLRRPAVTAFTNVFASYVPTGRSLNSVMTLSDPVFEPWRKWIYFQGQADSPLARVFRNNGYRISNGAGFGSFGKSGEFIDDYHPRADASFTASGLCRIANKHPFALFWICDARRAIDPPQAGEPWPEKLLSLLSDVAVDAPPRLTFHHVIITFHTQLGFDPDDPTAVAAFADEFESMSGDVRDYMDRLMSSVSQTGRDSILFGFGDHGTFVSAEDGFERDPAFFVRDRHGVSAAVYHDSTGCVGGGMEHFRARNHTTPERLVAGIIRCLADDPSSVDEAVDFSTQFDFSAFVYE